MFKVTGVHLRTAKRVCEHYQYVWLIPNNMLVRGSVWARRETSKLVSKGKWERIRRLG